MGDSDNSEKIEVLNNPKKVPSPLEDNTKGPDQDSVSYDSVQKIHSNDDNQGENSFFEDNPAENFITKEDKPSEQSNSEDNSQTDVNNDITLKINDGDVSLNNAYEDNKSLLEEENIETQEIDEEIDDAIDEGYMGMECTLERGFSLNESAVERELKEERYDELNVDYFSKSFPYKYTSALKHLVPVRKTCNDKDLIKVDSAGLFSFLTFNWITNIMWKAHKKDLQEEELPLCSKHEMCQRNTQRLNLFWEEEIKEKGIDKATLYRPVWRFIRTRILISLFIMICCLLVGLAGPTVFMRYLIEWLSTDEGIGIGIVWVLGLILCEAMRILSFATVWAMNYRTSLRLRGACLGLVYNKLMQMSNLGNTSIGEVINLFANDGQRIHDFVTLGSFFITGILVAVVAICYILYILGPWALLGMISFLFFYPFQYLISRLNGYLRRKTVTITDQRVRMMNEIFSCIKLIKMYAWESFFTQNVTDIRKQERKYLEKSAYVQCLSIAMTPVVPVIAAIITFLAHIGTGNNLTAAQAFSIVALLVGPIRSSLNMVNYSVLALVEFMESAKRLQAFSTLSVMTRVRGQLHYIPFCILAYKDFQVALERIKSILCLKELEKYISKKCQKDSAIEVKDATFAWSSISLPQSSSKKNKRDLDKINLKSKGNNAEEKLLNYSKKSTPVEILFDINLDIKKGELVGVCGGVGSGKSSLLLGLIGQMLLRKGSVAVVEDCAYVGQDSWILNASLRENILLGEHFDAKRYYKVMYACSLTEDVALLPAGDFTEIGERGINLSGGQKQRVSLARALYSNRNIYLFDDCLSAVDAHVGQHIFKWVFKYALKSKTVIFVTHQLQYLPDCNRVMFLRDGRIEEIGSHDELMATSGSYSMLFNKHLETLDQESLGRKHDSKSKSSYFNTAISPLKEDTLIPSGNKVEEKSSQLDSHFNGGRLTSKERSEVGDIPLSLYQEYIEFCGGYFVTFIVVFTFLLSAASAGFGSWWLSVWLGAGSGNATIVVGNETVVSDNIGDNPDFYLYRTVYGLTVIFILVTAVVRGFAFMKSTILGSSRMHNAVFDKIFHAPMVFFDTTPSGRILNIFSRDMDEVDVRLPTSMGMLLQNIWLILISLLFVALVFPYFLICLLFIAGLFLLIRQVFRNAIRDLKRFENISRSPIFTHISTTVNGLPSIQAFGKQQLFTKKFTKLFDDNTCYFYLFNSAGRWLAVRLDFLSLSVTSITALLCICLRNSVSPASAGLALAYAYQLSGIFQYTVRLSTEVEARFTSVQRIITHLKTVPSEAFQVIKGNKPNRNWPRFGRISFKKVELKYREETPLALKGVSFDIDSQEKIGVIGRTGSGKSSLGAALFRLVELKRGTIMIDGINIASLGLQDLRSRISIIPQDPLLFIGTIRNNLDPFGKHSDVEIWAVLEKTRLKETITSLEFKLSSPVIENGANFSVGERQLICMARALLRNNKILFLDEATAGIDTETDLKIQDTLREEFKNCTMITVAHRLNTIMNCSRVMVMDNGSVVEFDSPEKLLQDSSSRFAKLVAASKQGLYYI